MNTDLTPGEILHVLDTLAVEHGHIRQYAKHCDRCCADERLLGLVNAKARREAQKRIDNDQPDRLWLWINGLIPTLEAGDSR